MYPLPKLKEERYTFNKNLLRHEPTDINICQDFNLFCSRQTVVSDDVIKQIDTVVKEKN